MSEARYTCRDCGNDKTFTVKKSLKRHREEVHGEGQPSANQKIECAPCKKLFSREENFKRHVAQLHTETNLVVCHLCNKKKRKDALREHLRACEKRPGNREPAPVIILEETPERTNQTSQPIEPSPSVFEPSTLPRTWTTQTQHHDTSHALGREEREGIDSMQPVYSARADQPPEPSALVRQHRFDPPSFASLDVQSNAYSDFLQAFPHQQAQIASPNEQPSGHSWSSLDPGPGSVETRHGGHQDWAVSASAARAPYMHATHSPDQSTAPASLAMNTQIQRPTVQTTADLSRRLIRESKKDHPDIAVMTKLLDDGADVNFLDWEQTALHALSRKRTCDLDLLRLLIRRGAKVDALGHCYLRETPLHIACRESASHEYIKILLEAGADVNKRDRHQDTPIMKCCGNSIEATAIQAVGMLLAAGADINAGGSLDDGQPALHKAVLRGYLQLVRFLLDQGTDITMQVNGSTVLHAASCLKEGDPSEMIRLLLERGASGLVDKVEDDSGMTALGVATYYGHVGCVDALLNGGALVHVGGDPVLLARSADVMATLLNADTREHLLQDESLTECATVCVDPVVPIDNEMECLDVLLQVAATRQPVQLLATLSSTSQWMEEQMKEAEDEDDEMYYNRRGTDREIWNTNLLLIKAYEETLKIHGIFSLRALAEELQVRYCKFVPIPWHQHLAKAQRKIGKQEGIEEGEAKRAKENELKGAE